MAAEQSTNVVNGSSAIGNVPAITTSPGVFAASSNKPSLSPTSSTRSNETTKHQHLPLRVSSAGPPLNSYEVSKRQVRWEWDWLTYQRPTWKVDPNVLAIKSIARTYLYACNLEIGEIFVQFLTQGDYNKVYIITVVGADSCKLQQCIFRVALGIDPYYKIESDVATTEYVRRHTDIPVPRIYAFDSTTNNELGMEWMLMEKVKGISLRNYWGEEYYCRMHWDGSDWVAKTSLARLVADWVTQLAEQQFEKIGSLYIDWTRSSAEHVEFQVGRCLHPDFVRGKRLCFNIERGPFDSSHSYLHAFLKFAAQDVSDPIHKEALEEDCRMKETLAAERRAKQQLGEELTEQEKEDEKNNDDMPEYGYSWSTVNNVPRACDTLAQFLPKMFPAESGCEPFAMLYHFDITDHNLLVDSHGTPTALLDWEWAIVLPPQLIATGLPKVLQPEFETSVPDHGEGPQPLTDSSRAVRRFNELRQTDCYYKTKLRAVFRARLEELDSPWLSVYDNDTVTFYVLGMDNVKSRRNEVLETIEDIHCSWHSMDSDVERWESEMKEEMESTNPKELLENGLECGWNEEVDSD